MRLRRRLASRTPNMQSATSSSSNLMAAVTPDSKPTDSQKVARCAYVDLSVVICAISIGSWIATAGPGSPIDRIHQLFAPRPQVVAVAPEPPKALIITANRLDELTVI